MIRERLLDFFSLDSIMCGFFHRKLKTIQNVTREKKIFGGTKKKKKSSRCTSSTYNPAGNFAIEKLFFQKRWTRRMRKTTESSSNMQEARACIILNNHYTFTPKSHSHHQNPIRDDEKTILLKYGKSDGSRKKWKIFRAWFMCSKQILHMRCMIANSLGVSLQTVSSSEHDERGSWIHTTPWIRDEYKKWCRNAQTIPIRFFSLRNKVRAIE